MSDLPEEYDPTLLDAASMFESRIHTAVFYVVYLLLFGYGVLLPPYAVYWAEGISGPGWAVLMLGVTTSFFVFASRFHVLTTPQTRGVSNLLNKFRSGALGVSLLGRPPPVLELLPRTGAGEDYYPLFDRCHCRMLACTRDQPPIYWSMNARASARVIGTNSRPIVTISLGLLSQLYVTPALVEIVTLHELAHIRHGDPTQFAVLRALLASWPISSAAVGLACLASLVGVADRPLYLGLVLLVAVTWGFSLLAAWILMLRYAGVVFSLRELRADLAAAAVAGSRSAVVSTLQTSMVPQLHFKARLKSLFSLSLTHLSGPERLSFLTHPVDIVMPKLRYFALGLGISLIVQSSPFLEGFGHTRLIVFFSFLSWFISTALVASVMGTLWFAHKADIQLDVSRCAVLVIALAAAYQLPLLTMGSTNNIIGGLMLGFGFDAPTLFIEAVGWIQRTVFKSAWIWLLAFAAIFVVASRLLLRCDSERKAGISVLLLAIACGSLLHLAIIIALRWETETPSIIDQVADSAYSHRDILPFGFFCIIFAVLGVGIFMTSLGTLRQFAKE